MSNKEKTIKNQFKIKEDLKKYFKSKKLKIVF